MACMFIFIAQLEEDLTIDRWINSCTVIDIEANDFELYLCSCYYIFTTTSTVGYGDLSPQNTIERIFGMFLMLIGVVSFTFVSGALASIMQANDTREAEL